MRIVGKTRERRHCNISPIRQWYRCDAKKQYVLDNSEYQQMIKIPTQ